MGPRDRAAGRRGLPRRGRRPPRPAAEQPVRDGRSHGCATSPTTSPATSSARCRDRLRPQARFGTASTPGSRAASASSSSCSIPTTCPAATTRASRTMPTSRCCRTPSRPDRSPTAPPTPSRRPSRSCSAGQVVRGRIDAVYAEPESTGGGFLVVDWKTGRHETADPLQLALYRLAWAELHDLPLDQVRAAFHYVRSGRTVEPPDLPDRPASSSSSTSEVLPERCVRGIPGPPDPPQPPLERWSSHTPASGNVAPPPPAGEPYVRPGRP